MIFTTSWDDGNAFDHKLYELLKFFKIKGTLYIPERCKYRTLSETDVRKMSQYFEIGAHSLTHQDLTTLNTDEAEYEISMSKIYIEELTGITCSMFCYPFGKFNETVKEMVKLSGYRGARIVSPDFCEASILHEFHLPTTIQACMHTKDITKKLNSIPSNHQSLSQHFLTYMNTFTLNEINEYSWFEIAAFIYAEVKAKDGVFHLWGHSWEIEQQNLWEELEKFFQLITKDKKTSFLTNGELFRNA